MLTNPNYMPRRTAVHDPWLPFTCSTRLEDGRPPLRGSVRLTGDSGTDHRCRVALGGKLRAILIDRAHGLRAFRRATVQGGA